jgi:sugar phosphate isomerase/epimerase
MKLHLHPDLQQIDMKSTDNQTFLSDLCIHTITTKPWGINVAVEKYASAGVRGITVWRNVFENVSPDYVGKLVKEYGLIAVSLCRGGYFTYTDKRRREIAINDNLKAIDEACSIGAPLVVLVPGADPGQSLITSRDQIKRGIEAILPRAEENGIKLAIEPLHPVYADSRSAINTMAQANDLTDVFNSPYLGVAVDVYHVWWDPNLGTEINRAGKNKKLFAFHVCDWKSPTVDILNDRGLMGEGCIDIPFIRKQMNDSGFDGFNEVEIFSDIYWNSNQDEYLAKIIEAYKKYV